MVRSGQQIAVQPQVSPSSFLLDVMAYTISGVIAGIIVAKLLSTTALKENEDEV